MTEPEALRLASVAVLCLSTCVDGSCSGIWQRRSCLWKMWEIIVVPNARIQISRQREYQLGESSESFFANDQGPMLDYEDAKSYFWSVIVYDAGWGCEALAESALR